MYKDLLRLKLKYDLQYKLKSDYKDLQLKLKSDWNEVKLW